MIHPYRQKITKNPKDYGMDYEDVEFPALDGVKIKGWLVKGNKSRRFRSGSRSQSASGLIIQTHPMPFNRAGFVAKNQGPIKLFKENVDLLKTTKALNDAGYWVLTIDLRNCGQSGSGITAVGLNEWQDVAGALDYIAKNDPPAGGLKTMDIGFASFCMGANSTIIAASKVPEKFKNVKCALLVQPISMLVFLRTFIKNTFTVLSLPILPIMEFFARRGGSPKFADESPIEYAKDVKFPTLLIQGKFDKWAELSDTQQIFDNLAGKKELLFVDKPMPRFEVYNLVGQKPEKMLEFFKKYL